MPRFLVSTEAECLTVAEPADRLSSLVAAFLDELSQRVPSLPGPAGVFQPYGRVYLDGAHLEFAAAECASPDILVQIIAAQQHLARWAVQRLRARGGQLLLANNNHSGRLTADAPSWGSHGNFLAPVPPATLADRLLPFLATQVYAGAGGLQHPSGCWLAGTRIALLRTERGGDTMHQRALHSTAREEHHTTQPAHYGYRYHTIHNDGLRSEASQRLRFGTTLLVLHAVASAPEGLRTLPGPTGTAGRQAFWLQAAQHFNVLGQGGEPPRAAPLALQIQRLYWELTARAIARWPDPPAWVASLMTLWEATLTALERDDREWLARRLDAWIKYELVRATVDRERSPWGAIASQPALSAELALLCQRYHEFTDPENPFDRALRAGLLEPPTLAFIEPGTEVEPFVPAFGTRATARARFLVRHAHEPGWTVDWSGARRGSTGVRIPWDDPCAGE